MASLFQGGQETVSVDLIRKKGITYIISLKIKMEPKNHQLTCKLGFHVCLAGCTIRLQLKSFSVDDI